MATATMSKVIHYIRRAVPSWDEADITDSQLLACFIARRDEAAFATLVRRHGPMVWAVCRRILGSLHDAEDAFQACFLVLACKAPSITAREPLANWLYGVAQRTAFKARTAAARRRMRERQLVRLPEPEVARAGTEPDVPALLDEELSRLADKYRVPVVLCDLEGKTRKEAARQLRVPEGTVAGRLARARGILAKRLRRRGLAAMSIMAAISPSAAPACVPAQLVASTLKTASLLTAAGTAAGVIPSPVAGLVHGVLKAMILDKVLKTTALLLVAMAVLCGTGLFVLYASGTTQPRSDAQTTAQAPSGPRKKEDSPAQNAEKPKQSPAYRALNIDEVIPELGNVAALQSRQPISRIKQPTTFCSGFRFRYPYGPPGAAITFAVDKPENKYVWPPKVDASTPQGRKAIYETLQGAQKGGHFTMDGNELLVFGGARIVPFTFKDERVRKAWFDLFVRVPPARFAEFIKREQAAADATAGPIAGTYTLPLAKSSYFAALSSDNQVVILWIQQRTDFHYDVSHYLLNEIR